MVANLYIFNSDNSMKKNQHLKFFIKIVLLLTVLIISDQITGRIIRHLYFNMAAGENYRATFTIDNTKADILVFGSSRANHHYVPEVFEKKFNMTFYNAGRDGCSLLYNYATFKAVTKRYSPKLIIFDLLPNELNYSVNDYERLSNLLPYYFYHPELREVIELISPFEKYKLYSVVYPYNSQLIRIIFRNLLKTKDIDIKGYLPLYNKMKSVNANNGLKNIMCTIDENKITALREIASYCNKNNIKLIFACSPVFSNSQLSSGWKIIEDIAKSENGQYLNFSSDSIFDNHPEYFQDNSHLNDEGAKLYSKIICNANQELKIQNM